MREKHEKRGKKPRLSFSAWLWAILLVKSIDGEGMGPRLAVSCEELSFEIRSGRACTTGKWNDDAPDVSTRTPVTVTGTLRDLMK